MPLVLKPVGAPGGTGVGVDVGVAVGVGVGVAVGVGVDVGVGVAVGVNVLAVTDTAAETPPLFFALTCNMYSVSNVKPVKLCSVSLPESAQLVPPSLLTS